MAYCSKQAWYKQKYLIDRDNPSGLFIDLTDSNLINEYIATFRYVQRQLMEQSIIKQKVIYFSPLIHRATQQKLAAIASNHGAQISNQHTTAVTHVCCYLSL